MRQSVGFVPGYQFPQDASAVAHGCPDVVRAFPDAAEGPEIGRRKRRRFRRVLKTAIIAAVIVALLVAYVAVAYAKGFDLFDGIARWTPENFGLSSEGVSGKGSTRIPPQLQGIKEAMAQDCIGTNQLSTYWPERYEQLQIISSDNP